MSKHLVPSDIFQMLEDDEVGLQNKPTARKIIHDSHNHSKISTIDHNLSCNILDLDSQPRQRTTEPRQRTNEVRTFMFYNKVTNVPLEAETNSRDSYEVDNNLDDLSDIMNGSHLDENISLISSNTNPNRATEASSEMLDLSDNYRIPQTTANTNENAFSPQQFTGNDEHPVDEQVVGETSPNGRVEAPKKRRKTSTERQDHAREKHPFIRELCRENCKHKCTSNFTEDDLKQINSNYWDMNFDMRRAWLSNCVSRKLPNKSSEGSRKRYTYTYTLKKSDEIHTKVCQKTFLRTLGYSSDEVIQSLYHSAIGNDDGNNVNTTPPSDKRGRKCTRKINKTLIETHIESFKPCISHFRREHAPNRRYLSNDLSIQSIYNDFLEKNAEIEKKCSYEYFRKTFRDMNISFNQPGEDKCSTCLFYKLNLSEENEAAALTHTQKQVKARQEYNKDQVALKNDTSAKLFAVDMQKILLLPRMPDVKESFFTSRLVVFNETFASMQDNQPHYCIIWHEAVAGRNASEVASSYLKVIKMTSATGNITKFIFWADNCCAQNKNWTLFTALVHVVNDIDNQIEEISIKYLTTGHTFMAADGLHGKIEQKLKKKKNVFDMRGLLEVIDQSAERINSIEMRCKEIYELENLKLKTRRQSKKTPTLISEEKLPVLNSVVEVKFAMGSSKMLYKEDFESEYKTVEFISELKETYFDRTKIQPRGILEKKLDKIKKDLVPKMPESRREFWESLKSSTKSCDLATVNE